MSDWKEVYFEILSSYVGRYKEARGNSQLRNEILAEVKLEILKHEPEDSVGLPPHLRVAIRRVFLPHLDPEDQDDEIDIIQHILAVTRKSWAESCEGEDAREEKAHPTKAGDYKKAFTAFTVVQGIFKEEMDAYDRERRDTKDPKTIGQRNRIIQQCWEFVSEERKAEAGRAVEKWNKLGAPKETHDFILSSILVLWLITITIKLQVMSFKFEKVKSGLSQCLDSLRQPQTFSDCFSHQTIEAPLEVLSPFRHLHSSPSLAVIFSYTVHRTMGSHVVMFVAHEAGEGQIKMAVFETAPADGKKAFTQSSELSKDWVLNGENSLTHYLLTALGEDDSAEKHEVGISLDEDGNPEMPTWAGQKLKVQQNLARAVFQAAYVWGIAKFMKKPKARVPWGLLIKSPMEYLDSQSIPEGFTMKDPSKWTKADLGLLWDHWQTLEAEEKVIVSFISCKKEDAPLSRQFDRRPVAGSSKKREWMDPEDDSEEEVGEEGVHLGQMMKSGEVVNKGVEATMDVWDQAPEECSPAWHASKDHIQYLKSLSIMPRYQVLVDPVEALPEQEHGKGREVALPHWATWTWSAKYLPQEIHLESTCFWKALGELESARFTSSSLGGQVVLGLGLLLRECSHAQEAEEDDPLVSHLQFLLNSELGIQKAENVMGIVGLIVVRLEQSSGMKEPQEGDEGAGMGGTDREDEEKEEEEVPPVVPTQKWKRAESGIVTRGRRWQSKMGKKTRRVGKMGRGG
ncbi:hypothetical protein EDC04DRAFT_2602292 [Pisolithus marmoratus]|nr:hypothetical protein EDC04DRAFT_2602292 [Pisolithus marmoratus]